MQSVANVLHKKNWLLNWLGQLWRWRGGWNYLSKDMQQNQNTQWIGWDVLWWTTISKRGQAILLEGLSFPPKKALYLAWGQWVSRSDTNWFNQLSLPCMVTDEFNCLKFEIIRQTRKDKRASSPRLFLTFLSSTPELNADLFRQVSRKDLAHSDFWVV